VLCPNASSRGGAKIDLEGIHNGFEHVDGGDTHLRTALIDERRELAVDNRIKDDPRLTVDRLQDLQKLLAIADQRVDVLDRLCRFELRRSRTAGRNQCFASRVRNQMQMEEVWTVLHVIFGDLLKRLNNRELRDAAGVRQGKTCHFFHKS